MAGELIEEDSSAATTTIAFVLSKHQAALGTTNQYSAASTEDANIISNLISHPGVTIFTHGGVGNSVLRHLNKQATPRLCSKSSCGQAAF